MLPHTTSIHPPLGLLYIGTSLVFESTDKAAFKQGRTSQCGIRLDNHCIRGWNNPPVAGRISAPGRKLVLFSRCDKVFTTQSTETELPLSTPTFPKANSAPSVAKAPWKSAGNAAKWCPSSFREGLRDVQNKTGADGNHLPLQSPYCSPS
jgi:hypothetical protein